MRESPATAAPFEPPDCAAWAPLGRALLVGTDAEALRVRHEDGRDERLPLGLLRRAHGFTPSEEMALDLAEGRTVDLGCGAGAHAVELNASGFEVVALDRALGAVLSISACSPQASDLPQRIVGMQAALRDRCCDTVLLLMNGLGLARDVAGVGPFLTRVARLLRPGGQILVESADLTHSDDPAERELVARRRAAGRHPGESRQQLRWRDCVGEPFQWLYLPEDELTSCAAALDLHTQVVHEDGEGGYLARLVQQP